MVCTPLLFSYLNVANPSLGLIHRLDRPCSGVVVFAKTSKAAARLSECFRERRVGKDYLCVVNGDLRGLHSPLIFPNIHTVNSKFCLTYRIRNFSPVNCSYQNTAGRDV